jgi:hypothetical protein
MEERQPFPGRGEIRIGNPRGFAVGVYRHVAPENSQAAWHP